MSRRLNYEADKQFTQGDTRVSLSDVLVDREGNPVDLTDMDVALRMVAIEDDGESYGEVKINDAAAVVEDATGAEVRYDWEDADVDTAAEFFYWWVVEDGLGNTEHYPVGPKARIVFHPNPMAGGSS